MFRQRKNETRALRACKVGQQGLEQLDARVVPATISISLGLGNLPPMMQPPPVQKLVVQLDEYGGAQNAALVTSLSNWTLTVQTQVLVGT